MKSFTLCLIALSLIAGCKSLTTQSNTDSLAIQSQAVPLPAAQINNISGKSATPITYQKQQYWLLTSEVKGLTLTNANGKVLSTFAGNMEALDWRENIKIGTKNYTVITTLDNDSGQVLILGLDWQNKQLSLLQTLAKTEAQVEALCLHHMPQGHLSLFIANTLGVIEQRIIIDNASESLVDISVNTFIGTPETKACAVDDTDASLYLVEENIGVWRYSADPESELIRDLVTAVKPFGPLAGEVTDVEVLLNGNLLVSTPEQQGLWLIDNNKQLPAAFIQLTGTDKPETVNALQQDKNLLLGIYDDGSEQYLTTQLPLVYAANTTKQNTMESINAYGQTEPVTAYGDAADDPAIWINSVNPTKSRVLGTNKKQGMLSYDLQGNLLQDLRVGRVNNVDIRYNFTLGNQVIDLAAASNRSTKGISLFAIEQSSGKLTYLSDIKTDLGDVYGLCMYQQQDKYYVFINDTDGRYQQYLLTSNNNKIDGTLVREFNVPSQPEGCVADDKNKQLYFGEESTGIWQITAEPIEQTANLIVTTSDSFVADVEGMGLYEIDNARYLVASSQGNNSYGVFALDQGNRYLGSFNIDMNLATMVDGVSETDGLELTSTALGKDLPHGLLVVQDGRNRLQSAPQNFKLVDGRLVKQLIENWLTTPLKK